ncbi:MAG: phosphocholine cytidylyltransferase family protein [Tildeniella nuda ZEHNDER 1965/U140]|jgi:NDP-sugar pyrophosphorylase family protein|nr:phosphocholine cytidylyltransferase family protein [Tildeniella nuda ZEHNDER 1965/U140]
MNTVYQNPPPIALILAAGLGTRLGQITHNCPKCLVQVNDQPILSRILQSLEDCGVKEIVIVLGYRHEQVQEFLKNLESTLSIKTVVNQRFAETGTAISLQMGLTLVPRQRDVLVIEGDMVFESELVARVLAVERKNLSVLAPYSPEIDTNGSFAKCSSDGYVIGLYHASARPLDFSFENAWKTVNLYLLREGNWETILLTAIDTTLKRWDSTAPLEYAMQTWIEAGKLPLMAFNVGLSQWFEIDTPSDLAEAERHFICSN